MAAASSSGHSNSNTPETLSAIRVRLAEINAEMKEVIQILMVRDLHPTIYETPDRQTAMLNATAQMLTDLTKKLKELNDKAAKFGDDDE
ncbi:hypothetical protein M5689_013161 [Euphorbia peplus]|nr:hypothetical protein M5689_013161 [Euphorbia peplus]